MEYFNELLRILNDMSPYLMLGFFISGLLHVYVPRTIYSRFLHRKGLRSVIWAALLGIPLPLCSCGVIPTAMSLKKEEASDGAVVSFLVATPQTGVDSILATYSLLGLPFAIIRPITAFIVAILGGVLVDTFGEGKGDNNALNFRLLTEDEPKPHSCCCSKNKVQERSLWAVLKYGYVEMIRDFGKWLLVGLFIAAAITAFVPDSIFIIFQEHYILNILLILLISVPMYICSTGSIPIALSLMLKGLSPGAAFVLLMAGPATNFASLIILNKEIGLRKTIIYLATIILGAIGFALVIDFVLPAEWFSSLMPISSCSDGSCSQSPVWWQTTTSVIFIALFINSLVVRFRQRK